MPTNRTLIHNVRVIEGGSLTEPTSVLIDDGRIATMHHGPHPLGNADRFDGTGGILLPGLIDTHVHIDSIEHLKKSVAAGITTLLDMAAPRLAVVNALRDLPCQPEVRSAGIPATGPGAVHTARMGFPADSTVTGPGDARRFIKGRVTDGSDYIKIIVEDPARSGTAALSLETIRAVVAEAHVRSLLVIAHTAAATAVELAVAAGVDVLTHAPMDRLIDPRVIDEAASRGIAFSPTLTMMRAIAEVQFPPGTPRPDFDNACNNLIQFHAAGVTILAGTDANMDDHSPFKVPHGKSLHRELAMLVTAGLTPLEALRSATTNAAAVFGLADRGFLRAGLRADLLLVNSDPTTDISATQAIRSVWIAGERVSRDQTAS